MVRLMDHLNCRAAGHRMPAPTSWLARIGRLGPDMGRLMEAAVRQ